MVSERMGRHRDLAEHVDETRIRAAIDAAERRTSGIIHVTIAKRVGADVRRAAERAFISLGFSKADARAVLFFVVPARRAFVVLGSAAVHHLAGESFWDRVVDAVTKRARAEHLTAALVDGIAMAGDLLAREFPRAEP